jgi:hypothetical protein
MCMLHYSKACTGGRGALTIDHLIPLSSNKLIRNSGVSFPFHAGRFRRRVLGRTTWRISCLHARPATARRNIDFFHPPNSGDCWLSPQPYSETLPMSCPTRHFSARRKRNQEEQGMIVAVWVHEIRSASRYAGQVLPWESTSLPLSVAACRKRVSRFRHRTCAPGSGR